MNKLGFGIQTCDSWKKCAHKPPFKWYHLIRWQVCYTRDRGFLCKRLWIYRRHKSAILVDYWWIKPIVW